MVSASLWALRPKLIAKEASLKPRHENQGSVSACQRRAAPTLRLRGCSAFSRAGIRPAPCTCLSILSLTQGFLSLLNSVLGKPVLLHAISSLFPEDEEIFLLSSNHYYSSFQLVVHWYCQRKKVTNWVTTRHRHCQIPTCMWDDFEPSFGPDFLLLPHLQRLWCAWWCKAACRWVRAAQPVPIPIQIPIPIPILTRIAVTGLWALECWWLLLTFASLDNLHALHQCIPPSNNRCCFLPLSTCPRSAPLPAPAAQLHLTLHFQPQGAASPAALWFLTLAFPLHTLLVHLLLQGFPLLSAHLPAPSFPVHSMTAGPGQEESLEMCIHLSCSLLLEV